MNTTTTGPSHTCRYGGTEQFPIYVDVLTPPPGVPTRTPLVFIHGAFHTGSCYLQTPDNRAGWAHYMAQRGWPCYVIDWPGHGRSPARVPLNTISSACIVDSLGHFLQDIGPAILIAHSAGGPLAWALTEQYPEKVVAIVGVAPGGPANLQQALPDDPEEIKKLRFDESAGCPIYADPSQPFQVTEDFIREFWANSPQFPLEALANYALSVVPESPTILNERFNIGGKGLCLHSPEVVRQRPILILTGERDPRHPKHVDQRLATYLNADFVFLPDHGVYANGHMLMIEKNSDETVAIIHGWLSECTSVAPPLPTT